LVKPNDSYLTQEDYLKIKSEANKILQESDTLGIFPTPIEQILIAANVEEVPDQILDESFLKEIKYKVSNSLKSAVKKVLGLFDAVSRLIFIDKSLYFKKQNFIRLHEAGHAYMPHQSNMYKVVEECEYTLSPDVADQFDIEANVFASEVLFQSDSFINEAMQSDFSIKIPMNLSKKFDASIYASIRQYVSKHHQCCVVLVINQPKMVLGAGFNATLRRVEASSAFKQGFSKVKWPKIYTPDDEIGKFLPINGRRMSGRKQFGITDDNGTLHEFTGEAFTNTYQTFVLLHQNKTLNSTNIIMP